MSRSALIIVLLVLVLLFVTGIAILFGLFDRRGMIRADLSPSSGEKKEAEPGSFSRAFAKMQGKGGNDTSSKNSGVIPLEARLRYGNWRMSPLTFRLIQLAFTAVVFLVISQIFNVIFQVIFLFVAPRMIDSVLERAITSRFDDFDRDYPAFLLAIVGMLKLGMNPTQAIEAAAAELDPSALIKIEVQKMIERLRLGVAEDKSIGSFGEDIAHPEIELFVQALLLSRRVGGTLSDSLERLARQVRRRQYFRASAKATVGLQRGSIWAILLILCGVEVYLGVMYFSAIENAFLNPDGWAVSQFGLLLIFFGVVWMRGVTKIKI